jgi:hypothetical protein
MCKHTVTPNYQRIITALEIERYRLSDDDPRHNSEQIAKFYNRYKHIEKYSKMTPNINQDKR